GRIDRLTVVVKIKSNRPSCRGSAALGDDDGRTGGCDAIGQETPELEQARQRLRVALDIALVRRDVGKLQKIEQLEQDLLLVLLPPGAHAADRIVRRRRAQRARHRHQTQQPFELHRGSPSSCRGTETDFYSTGAGAPPPAPQRGCRVGDPAPPHAAGATPRPTAISPAHPASSCPPRPPACPGNIGSETSAR